MTGLTGFYYRPLIEELAKRHELDPLVVEAIVWQESGGRTHAYRFENGFWLRYLAHNPEYQDKNPDRVSASYGLMQVMYTTAVECGFRGEPELLFVPRIGLQCGCEYLARLLKWANGDQRKAFAAYNGGKGNAMAGPPFPNEKYVKSVEQWIERVTGAVTA